jgi:patatin-related protein
MVERSAPVGVQDQQITVADVAAQPAMVPETSPSPPRELVRELRLALVCYGGVSLAIYMHGVTMEFERLVAASVAYQRDQNKHSFDDTDTASVYWELLRGIEQRGGVRTKVVVDIVSGTSAGGINGMFLAAALARNRSQQPLRQMWMDKGDVKRLLKGRESWPTWMKTPRLLRSLVGRQPLFDGQRISRWLRDALNDMGPDRPPIVDGVDSLLGDEERLQLFVPITDFFGYDVHIPADDPAWVLDRTHRHVMQFVHDSRDPALDQLSPKWDDALAFSARATSSFPLAFPPLSVADYASAVPETAFDSAQRTTLFGAYPIGSDEEPVFAPDRTHFMDGGVLDNKPFATTLAAIKLRPAATEVDRRLIYVEPDPATEGGPVPDGSAPGLIQTVIGGYAGIPRQEPIILDLTELAVHNANVARIRDVIETNFDPVRQRVSDFVAGHGGGDEVPSAAQLGEWRTALSAAADAEAGYSYPTYLRLRLRAVLDGFATMIVRRQEYAASSAQALFVQRVLSEWAESQDVFAKSPTATEQQRKLIDTLDLARLERQIRFLIAALSWWYKPSAEDSTRVPDRQQLDHAKHDLYLLIDELNDLARLLRDDENIRDRVDQVFGRGVLVPKVPEDLDGYVVEHSDELAQLQSLVQMTIGSRLAMMFAALDEALVRITASWKPWARNELLTRHLGFAFWDIILYPIQAVSGVNERDYVEVMRFSPFESNVVATSKEKQLKGVTLGHFGAFFSRPGRENDYLWGRLDTAERLIVLLSTPPGRSVGWFGKPANGDADVERRRQRCIDDVKKAARVIVDSERANLKQVGDRLDFVISRVS